MKLKKLTKNFTYVNDDITEENFPVEEIRGEFKVFHFDKLISSEEVIEEIQKAGYKPTNLYELLEYAKNEWNGEGKVVALGFLWVDPDGFRLVPGLVGDGSCRDLCLGGFADGWNEHYHFLAVRKKSNSIEECLADMIKSLDILSEKFDELIKKYKNKI